MTKTLAALLAVTAGCATAEVNDAFVLAGRIDSARVTHVVATNADTGVHVAVPADAYGRFELALEPGVPWVVTLADWTKVGKDMQVATLHQNGIDAFVAQEPTTLDLGVVEIVDRRAHGTVELDELIDALGVDRETATRMGRTDNLALRYANPDVDNDGTIDALQHGHDFHLDISGAFKLTTNGREATVADLVGATWAAPGIRYAATTIQAVVPRSMGMNMASGTLRFQEPFFGTALGDATPMVAAGYPVGAPHVKVGERDGQQMIGVVAHGTHDAPSGTYNLMFDNGQLTFSDVHVPSAALLSSGELAVPFVRIRPTVATCTVDCDIAGIDLAWRSFGDAGWQDSAGEPSRLEIVTIVNGTRAYLAADLDAGATSLAWSAMPVGNAGITRSELAYVQTSEICYVAVSYRSELGMKMTMSAVNPACY